MKYVVLLSLTFLFLSCSGEKKKFEVVGDKNGQELYTLVKTDSLIIPIDSTQGFLNNSISQLELADGTKLFSLLNRSTGVVYYYDLNSGDLIKKMKLNVGDGPNGIGNSLDQVIHLDLSEDSILVYNAWTTTMKLVSGTGEVLNTYYFPESELFNNEGPFYISFTNDNVPIYEDGKVYFNIQYNPDQYLDKGVLMMLDLESGEFSSFVDASSLYSSFCWGGSFSLNVLNSYVPDKQEFVFSFGVDPYVYVWSKEGELKEKKLLKSKFFETEYFSDDLADYRSRESSNERSEFSQLSPKYYKILHLKESGMFLRETFLERSEEDKMRGVRGLKKSIIIADEELNKVGEYRVPDEEYFTSNFLLGDGGIYLANLDFYYENEDYLKFDFYEPRKIED